MKALVFNGAFEKRKSSTSARITEYVAQQLKQLGIAPTVFNIADAEIPLFDVEIQQTPDAVVSMNAQFRAADIHIWLTPLYHGSMTGAMKNCLDWLEYSAKQPQPYLTGKIIGLVCWADGVQAMQGINAMDAVAKALRAWTAPLSIPIQRSDLFDENGNVTAKYKDRFEKLLQLMLQAPKI